MTSEEDLADLFWECLMGRRPEGIPKGIFPSDGYRGLLCLAKRLGEATEWSGIDDPRGR